VDNLYDVEIERIGVLGDGIAQSPLGPAYVPFGLPSEVWRIGEAGAPVRLTDSPDRIVPPCPHFDRCGGCLMQHVGGATYDHWKRDLVVQALAHQGITAEVGELFRVPLGSRRRVVLGARVVEGACILGFHEARGHDLVDIDVCAVMRPEIVGALDDLRAVARLLAEEDQPLRISVLASDTGLDVALNGAALPGSGNRASIKALSAKLRQQLAQFVTGVGWARLSVAGEVVVLQTRPLIRFGETVVAPPMGVFLQAVREAEVEMQRLVVRAAGRSKTMLDLFAGLGTLTFPLAQVARVLAVDSDQVAIAALDEGRRLAHGLKPVTSRVRDLFREPMSAKELEPFDCAVFDPPRAGAAAQALMLGKSTVPKVVAVSCNPVTLARDLRILLDGGYEISEVTPIDQFMFSSHVEVVVVLKKGRPRRRATLAQRRAM